ncbi:MAG TPA: PGPGW domain-containing protein [Sphingomicrobium sp.]|nr:PGPGW domain-containing protein [Sphingomicrobium sp.]
MMTRDQLRKFMDQPWVEWGLLAFGVVLVVLGLIIAPLPGPGGVFLIAPGAALILKTSMWAKRRYVKFKRWQPKAGRWTDWALQRRSAKRREALRKAEEEQRPQVPESGGGN